MQTPKRTPAGFGARLDNHHGDESPIGFPIPEDETQIARKAQVAATPAEPDAEIVDAEFSELGPDVEDHLRLRSSTHWRCPKCQATQPREVAVMGSAVRLNRCMTCGALRPGNA